MPHREIWRGLPQVPDECSPLDLIVAKDKVTPAVASDLANLFDALSDPTRILIISALLDGEVGVSELVERLGLTKSAVSHQLRGLRDKRLIRTRKQGRNVFVCLDDDHVIELFKRGLDHVLHG
ncbi:MAG: transcriptional regulator [Anaerolineales bacterium]|nr:winged helix-turn-helix transcriptional regulator [Anaerolineae bacterium]PWB78149.1 MAG: transcriptional regulator [Anaerolineales bacterium]